MRTMHLLPLALLAAACAPDNADGPWLQDLDASVPQTPGARRTRTARVLRDLVPGSGSPFAWDAAPETLTLDLFDDLTIDAELDRLVQRRGATTWVGHLMGQPDQDVVITTKNGAVSGTVHTPDGTIILQPGLDGVVGIVEVDVSSLPEETSPLEPTDLPLDETPAWETARDGTDPVVDLMIVYTKPVLTYLGSASGVEATAESIVETLNTGFEDSGLAVRGNLVSTRAVDWDETGFSWAGTLGDLADDSDGVLDEVPTWRDVDGADAVTLLVVGDGRSCGIGYLMSVPRASFASAAYNVVDVTCATGNHSMAHELGHNLGSQHDRDNASSAPAYSYGYGHRDATEGFRTVMSYACSVGSCPRINRWSDPDATWGSAAMGVSKESSSAAHNVASLTLTAPIASDFRDSKTSSEPTEAAPILLPRDGDTLGGASATFVWGDVEADEYVITIGTAEGSDDVLRVSTGTDTSYTASSLPTDGKKLYVTLWSEFDGTWLTDTATYTAAAPAPRQAALTQPAADSLLPGAVVDFTWEDAEASSYVLALGSRHSATDLGTFSTTATSMRVKSLPTDGRAVWATLYTVDGDTWRSNTYMFRASSDVPITDKPAHLLSPTPGGSVARRTLTFEWTDVDADSYAVTVMQGATEVGFATATKSTVTVTLSSAVAAGELQVRLATRLDGVWFDRNYTLTYE